MKTRTLRGRLTDTVVKQLVVDDGRFTAGYKVKEFRVWVEGDGADAVYAILGKEYDMLPVGDASDARQIAWAASGYSTGIGGPFAGNFSVIDPDHVVIQDLYIKRVNPADICNYLIVLELMDIKEEEAILQLIKERSQDDQR